MTRQEYENCHVYPDRDAHMVVNCSNPLRRKRFTILFEEFQAIPNVSEFVPGSTYYYISESDQRVNILSNSQGNLTKSARFKYSRWVASQVQASIEAFSTQAVAVGPVLSICCSFSLKFPYLWDFPLPSNTG